MSERARSDVLIYGAYGYTGTLICDEALRRGLRPHLAGRDAQKLQTFAESRGLEHRAVSLDDPDGLRRLVGDSGVVVHCAGPFSRTFEPMIEACLETGTHYLDITGEWQVFRAAAERDAAAREAGVLVLPGVGFDVVPSDCLAAHLARRLPGASELALGFQAIGRASRGTARTAVESAGRGWIRRDGELRRVPAAWRTRTIDFGRGPKLAVTIPWGDIVTAWHTTAIPNIEVYRAASPAFVRAMRWTRWTGWFLRTSFAQKRLRRKIDQRPAGPSDEERERGRSLLWGEIRHADGRTHVSRLEGPEGYTLTALTAVEIVQRVLAGEAEPGFRTPAGLFGADFVLSIDGVVRSDGG